MKKLTAAIAISLVICVASSMFSSAAEVRTLTDKVIRLHVVANSDSELDQSLKLKVRDGVLELVSELTADVDSKEEAEQIIKDNLELIEDRARLVLDENGCAKPVSASYEYTLIDTREYDDFTLPYGHYDTLCIRIGEANGKNWWCVLYPSLCVSCAVSIDECGSFSEDELVVVKEPQKVKFKLFCFELFEWVRSWFVKTPELIEADAA